MAKDVDAIDVDREVEPGPRPGVVLVLVSAASQTSSIAAIARLLRRHCELDAEPHRRTVNATSLFHDLTIHHRSLALLTGRLPEHSTRDRSAAVGRCVRPSRSAVATSRSRSHVCLLGDFKSIVDLDSEIPDGAFKFCVTE